MSLRREMRSEDAWFDDAADADSAQIVRALSSTPAIEVASPRIYSLSKDSGELDNIRCRYFGREFQRGSASRRPSASNVEVCIPFVLFSLEPAWDWLSRFDGAHVEICNR